MRYLNFTNLQYGTSRRFQPPSPPPVNRTIQSVGAYNIRCPQGEPAWLSRFGQPVGNLTEVPPVTIADLPAIDPSISEDCLYLDLFVPEAVFQAKEDRVFGGHLDPRRRIRFGMEVSVWPWARSNEDSEISRT